MNRVLLTVKEASEITGLCPDRIYRLCQQDKFPHKRLGGRVYIPRKALMEFLGENEPAPVIVKQEPPDPKVLAEMLLAELRKIAG